MLCTDQKSQRRHLKHLHALCRTPIAMPSIGFYGLACVTILSGGFADETGLISLNRILIEVSEWFHPRRAENSATC